MHKKPARDLAQVKQRLMEDWADFEQTVVDKAVDQCGGSDSGPVSGLKDSIVTHGVICDAVHCLNRLVALSDYCFGHR